MTFFACSTGRRVGYAAVATVALGMAGACSDDPSDGGPYGDDPPYVQPECTNTAPSGPLTEAPFDNGTRLVAHALYADGMQPWFLAPHDLVTGEDCTFSSTTEGQLICSSPSSNGDDAVATESTAPAHGTLHVLEIHGSDGSRFPDTYFGTIKIVDDHWATSCGLETRLAGSACGDGECVPPAAHDYGLFADADCKERLVTADTGQPVPPIASTTSGVYYTLGAPYTGPIHQRSGAGCELASELNFAFFRLGQPLETGAVAPTLVSYQGSGRLQIATVESAGVPMAVGEVGMPHEEVLFDTTLGTPCQPIRTPHDGVRCFPGAVVAFTGTFTDPACTQPAITNGISPVALSKDISSSSNPVPEVTAIGSFDPSHQATAIFRIENGACTEALDKQDFYAFVEDGDPTSLAPIEERIGDQIIE